MKKILLLITALFGFHFLSAQTDDAALKNNARVDLSLAGLGITYEQPVSKKILLEGSIGLGAGYWISSGDFNYRWYLNDPVAFFSLGGKYFYNRQKRLENSNSLLFNSGNYFGIHAKYTTKTLRFDDNWETMLIGAHWGIQKSIGKHFSWGLNLGLGYAFDMSSYKDGGSLYPDINVRISYILPFIGNNK
ncbi:hypothetical protein [Dysgonomonas sp. 520]|uniref:hypothetical protein n=1 Tax=Dysgonomonas sp. 520 TaxID=2302931 RepID=UPI0013D418D4|nr:hypothetical protein [Dysgonomonas sp. 520]NDW08181.1 hypothetical protein [Dysgonomonas sp. 520]